jgi:hypothetical protein
MSECSWLELSSTSSAWGEPGEQVRINGPPAPRLEDVACASVAPPGRACQRCQRAIEAARARCKRAKYCQACSALVRREQSAAWKRNRRKAVGWRAYREEYYGYVNQEEERQWRRSYLKKWRAARRALQA